MFGLFEFIFVGVLVGFCVGIIGVGGGLLMILIFISFFRIEFYIVIGIDLFYVVILKFCGLFVYVKKLNIVWLIVFWFVIGSIFVFFVIYWVFDNYLS